MLPRVFWSQSCYELYFYASFYTQLSRIIGLWSVFSWTAKCQGKKGFRDYYLGLGFELDLDKYGGHHVVINGRALGWMHRVMEMTKEKGDWAYYWGLYCSPSILICQRHISNWVFNQVLHNMESHRKSRYTFLGISIVYCLESIY